MGQPAKMAELMAQLDGPVYVERVALYDNKQRVTAQRAIKRGLQLQVENRGFALIEVLAECPLHLGKTPREAEQWVKEWMPAYFPLGVKKEVAVEPRPPLPRPDYDPERLLAVLGATTEAPPRFADGLPQQLGTRDLAIKFAGAGGDGAQTAAMLLTHSEIHQGFDATHLPSYAHDGRSWSTKNQSQARRH